MLMKVTMVVDWDLQTLPSLMRLSRSFSSCPAFTNSGPRALQWPHLGMRAMIVRRMMLIRVITDQGGL